ncbi:MAG: multicopper oxidase family protein [Candidatus Gracilibacteria bacterium]|nr:multicopper oxidase family protein [Candidatus Gracilibacteria bacterium]
MKKNTIIIVLVVLLTLFLGYIIYLYSINYMNMGNMHGNNSGMGNMHNSTNNKTTKSELIYGKGQEAVEEKKQEIVNLKDGDNYTIEIVKIKKNIGGKQVEMLAYNGSIPGPLIKVKEGAKVKLTIVNKVADLETTLHSHGLRLSDMFDGVVKDMMGKQDPILEGDSFTYELSFPDVGVFWYHPHLREDIQQELGLYGNYIVEPTDDNYYSKVNREESIILDDISLNGNKLKPFYKEFTNYVLMGRFGSTMFINGNTDYVFNMKKGEVVRVYLTDVANTRIFNFKIPGVKMKLVGSDIGKYEKETFIDNIVISPGERYIVDLYAPDFGTFEIQNSTPDNNYVLGKVLVSNENIDISYKSNFETLNVNTDIIKDIDNYRKYFDKKVDKNLSLELGNLGKKGGITDDQMGNMNMGHGMMGDNSNQDIEWDDNMLMMNQLSTSLNYEWKIIDKDTKKENMDINWQFKKGDIVKIHIENKKDGAHPMQHPFHIHGQRFLVINRDGKRQENLVWKDTVLLKTGENIDILVDMSNPGEWMSHCHISEHLFSGMMMHFSVKE